MTVSLSTKKFSATVHPTVDERSVVIDCETVRTVRFEKGVSLDHLDIYHTDVSHIDISGQDIANLYCKDDTQVTTSKDGTQKIFRAPYKVSPGGEVISGVDEDLEGEAKGVDTMADDLTVHLDKWKRVEEFFQRITDETEGRLVAPPNGSPRWDVLAYMYEDFISRLPEVEQLELAFKILDSITKPLPESLVSNPNLALEYQVRLERMRPVGVTSGREGEVIYDEDGTYSRINDMIARESGMPASTASINDRHNQPIAVMCGGGDLFRILRDHRGLPVEVLQVDPNLNTYRTEYVYDVYGLLQSSTQDGITRTYHHMWHENILIEFYMEEGIDETSRFAGIKAILRFKI